MQLQTTRLDETNPTTLYRHYAGELESQGCYVSLDLEDGELTADWNGEIGNSVPESVWNGRKLRWGIPCLTSTAANKLLDELAPIAQRILDGATIEWDGNNNVGQLTEAAQVAAEELAEACAAACEDGRYARIAEYEAADWYSEGEPPAVTAAMTDDELDALAEQLQADDAGTDTDQTFTDNPGDYVVLTGLDDYLANLRATAREVAEDELQEAAEAVAEATERRDELVAIVSAWRPSRVVGEMVNLSHTQVQRIVKEQQTGQ